jgi:hypothetical protein
VSLGSGTTQKEIEDFLNTLQTTVVGLQQMTAMKLDAA